MEPPKNLLPTVTLIEAFLGGRSQLPSVTAYSHMVVSQNRGTPLQTPKFYNPYDRDPQNGTPNFWETPISTSIGPSQRRPSTCAGRSHPSAFARAGPGLAGQSDFGKSNRIVIAIK